MKNAVICFSLIVIGLIFSSPGYTAIDPATVAGYWSFDEGKGDVAEDSSGNGNHGKLFGPEWADGMVGKALKFDGVDDYVNCGNDVSLDPPHITMVMWVWFDHIPYVHDIALNKEGKYRLIGGEVDNTHLSVRYATTNTAWAPGIVVGKTELKAETWYHAAATYDGEKWRLYLDGQLDEEKAESGDLVSNANILYIGMYQPPTGWPFTGLIDEVGVYNVALSQADINSLMAPAAVSPAGKLSTCWATIKSRLGF